MIEIPQRLPVGMVIAVYKFKGTEQMFYFRHFVQNSPVMGVRQIYLQQFEMILSYAYTLLNTFLLGHCVYICMFVCLCVTLSFCISLYIFFFILCVFVYKRNVFSIRRPLRTRL